MQHHGNKGYKIPLPNNLNILFQDYDDDEDAQITFQEFALNGGLDHLTMAEFKQKFLLEDNKLNEKLLAQKHPILDEDGSPSYAGIISRLYTIFKIVDVNKACD